jgi:membrane protease YdiL (CAAX protease family)
MKTQQKKSTYLLLEFVLFFVGVPVILLFEGDLSHPSRVLVPIVLFVFGILYFRTDFKWNELSYLPVKFSDWSVHLGIAILISGLMLGWVYFFDRDNLFNLPSRNWKVWLLLSLFYPVFSASLQEVIFRTFIFKRYQKLFGNGHFLILASAIVFSFAHIFYFHPVSLLLTFILGLYLGWVYHQRKSVLFTSILHSIYGNMVFTIGLGHYFWLDMARWM